MSHQTAVFNSRVTNEMFLGKQIGSEKLKYCKGPCNLQAFHEPRDQYDLSGIRVIFKSYSQPKVHILEKGIDCSDAAVAAR